MGLPLIGGLIASAVPSIISGLFGKKSSSKSSGSSSLLETALPALIQGGTGLLGGLLSGKQKEQERKQAIEDWQKVKDIKISDLDKINAKRYRTAEDLSTIDPMLKKLMVGKMSQFTSPEQASGWGIDFSSILSGLGGGTKNTGGNSGGSQETPSAGGRKGGRARLRGDENFAQGIMQKYGMDEYAI